MGKSSSSKRKRSDAPSSVRSRKSARSKSGWTKSKKKTRGRLIDSDSRSLSSSSDSYSSSGDNHRRSRRSRSFSRKDDRKSRTRVRRDSYSHSSDEGSTPPKKRKDYKRKGDSSMRRKSVKKRHKRDRSVSSTRRRSLSCSPCANRSSSEDEYEHHRGRSERRESRVVLENRQRRDRSCSRSSCGRSSCGGRSMLADDSRSEERAIVGNSMRLRSVIFVVKTEDMKLEGKENEEEIVYDKDDYPSSRSNDSYDDESKKAVAHHSHVFLDKVFSECEKGKDVKPSGGGGNWTDENQGNSKIFDGSGHNDLETMLRQRALQNLQNLRGIKKIETNRTTQEPTVSAPKGLELPIKDLVSATGATSRDSSEDVAERSRITKEKTVYARPGEVHAVKQSGSASEAVVTRITANNLRQEARPTVAPVLNNPWKTAYTWRREKALMSVKQLISPQKPNPPLQMKTQTIRSTNAARSFHNDPAWSQLHVKELNSLQKLKTTQAKRTVTETTSPASIVESGRDVSTSSQPPPKELGLPQEPKPLQAKPVVTETVTATSALENPHKGTPDASSSKVPKKSSLPTDQSTLAGTTPGAVSAEKIADEANEGPQYEQKMMSVTRGGETIQVNYQVYIPRRAPTQARRQLKRDS